MKIVIATILLIFANSSVFSQADVQVGTTYQLNIQRQNQHADAFILHNAEYSSQEDQLKWETTNANFGSRGIRFGYGASKGIYFYADVLSAQAGIEFTPTTRMFIRNDGFVGVGTTAPSELFQVGNALQRGLSFRLGERASFGLSYTHAETVIGNNAIVVGAEVKAMNTASGASAITMKWSDGIHFYTTSGAVTSGQVINTGIFEKMRITPNDGVFAEQITVELQSEWPDYVFEKEYQLPDLETLENFIQTNKHLPGISNADEIAEKGINLGQMDAKLLEKIEQLTLYLIEQNKKIDRVILENKELRSQLIELQNKNGK